MTDLELKRQAVKIRQDIIEGVHAAASGHPGGSLSAADAITVLYFDEMNIDPQNPKKPDRDRFVLSKGHAAPAMYAALARKGYFPLEDIKSLRHIGCHLQGHPSVKDTPGVDASSGSLGQGVSVAVGMAIAAKLKKENWRVYAMLGDGELQEGQVWEAAMLAGFRKLDNLCLLIDNNGLQIDGDIAKVNSPYPINEKFEAFGFFTLDVKDGNDIAAIRHALAEAKELSGKPVAIVLHTVKGKGVSFMENDASWHGRGPNDEEYEKAMAELKEAEEAL
ncbi:MAG: transketolase [Lachnospiraceae bacterium]|nr:transketolase [Lachnospiraceae bacterium]